MPRRAPASASGTQELNELSRGGGEASLVSLATQATEDAVASSIRRIACMRGAARSVIQDDAVARRYR